MSLKIQSQIFYFRAKNWPATNMVQLASRMILFITLKFNNDQKRVQINENEINYKKSKNKIAMRIFESSNNRILFALLKFQIHNIIDNNYCQRLQLDSNQNQQYCRMQEQLTLPEMLCPWNKAAFMACKNQKCETSGLICLDSTCECKKVHVRCTCVQVSGIVQGLAKSKKNLPKGTAQTFSAIETVIEELYEEVNNLRESFKFTKSAYGSGKNSSKLLGYIYSKQFQRITGKLIERVEHEQDAKIDQLAPLEQTAVSVQQNWENDKPHFERLIRQIQGYFLISDNRKNQKTASKPVSKSIQRSELSNGKSHSVQKKQQNTQSKGIHLQNPKQSQKKNKIQKSASGGVNGRPKKPLTSYFIFINKTRKNIQKDFPEVKPNDMNNLFVQVWEGLDPSQKEIYEKQARQLRAQYQQKLYNYWKSHPEEMTKGEKRRMKIMEKQGASSKKQSSQGQEAQQEQEQEEQKNVVLEKLAQLKENLKNYEKKKVKIVQSDEQLDSD